MASPDNLNPFTPDDVRKLQELERKLAGIIELMDKCEACNLDVSGARELHKIVTERLRNLRQAFLIDVGG